MQSKLSDLADNLSKINNKDCKKCMESKNIRSECESIGLKNNRLHYKCKECNETSAKSINDLTEKFPTTYKDYLHAQKVWDVFEIRNLGEYHDLYVQTDTLLLADVYEKFRDKCIEIYGLDPSHFLSAPGLAWQACLKKQM